MSYSSNPYVGATPAAQWGGGLGTHYVGATPRTEWAGGYAGMGQMRMVPRARYVPPGIRSWAGATPRQEWAGGYAGMGAFGVMVPTPLPGNPSYAPDMKATGYNYCGSKFGFQQMLQDLGYYKGPIDGKIGTGSLAAAKNFAADHNVVLSGGLSNAFCQKLIDVWAAKMGGGPAPPGAQPVPTPVPVAPAAAVAPTSAPASATLDRSSPPVEKHEDTVLGTAGSWWESQSTGVKAAVGIGGVAVVGLTLYALLGGDKKKPAYAANNRRR
jgi:hypothetical protein